MAIGSGISGAVAHPNLDLPRTRGDAVAVAYDGSASVGIVVARIVVVYQRLGWARSSCYPNFPTTRSIGAVCAKGVGIADANLRRCTEFRKIQHSAGNLPRVGLVVRTIRRSMGNRPNHRSVYMKLR